MMKVLYPDLLLVQEKFPLQSIGIEELYHHNTDFRSLCEDYFLCINALDQYQKESGDDQNTLKEYDDLRKELETELENFINEEK